MAAVTEGKKPTGEGGAEGSGGLGEVPHDYEVFFKRNFGALLGFFLKRRFSRQDAEDLAQETLTRALNGNFRGESSSATWLFIIAGNVWRNHLRDKNAQKRQGKHVPIEGFSEETLLTEILVGGGNSEPPGLHELLAAERLRLLSEAIQTLPPQMRRAIQLYDKLKYQEIAATLRIEVNTVKSLISQAKVKLKEILVRDHPELFEGSGGPP